MNKHDKRTHGPFIATVAAILREKNSVTGNPRYRLILVDDIGQAGMPVEVWTAPDSSLGYSITNLDTARRVSFNYRMLRGKATIVHIHQ